VNKAAWIVVGVVAWGCGEKKNPSDEPVVPAEFAKKHKSAVEAFRAKVGAAANLVKDLPATSVHVADPQTPLVLLQSTYIEGPNGFLINGWQLQPLPEFGKYKDQEFLSGKDGISIVYSDFLDIESGYSMIEGGKPRFDMSVGAADYLAKKIGEMMRYVIIHREVSYVPGTVDIAAKTFMPGTYNGVAHIVDLQGPKHLGSVVFTASNTGSFESHSGRENNSLQANLRVAALHAFAAEMAKVFPAIKLPELPKKS
jgi:hypothetical protein